jgi:alpha-ketoglutaric semialdehyde dehydrogenase
MGPKIFTGFNPATGEALPVIYTEATAQEIDEKVKKAETAFALYRLKAGTERAAFLESIGQQIMALGDELIDVCHLETALPVVRLQNERARTIHQCNLFAALVREGSWVNARIDTAQPGRKPLPKPDLRQLQIPLGTAGVFGASNFPLAFSVAGGDTVSALAAGCTVVVKGHPSHPSTSAMVAGAISRAAKETGMPDGVFVLIQGVTVETGMAIVKHPLIKAIGFTGSTKGGTAIAAAAAARLEPIPVYAEMGSTNPVFILPGALQEKSSTLASGFAASATLGVGQFCTNPGLVVMMQSTAAVNFLTEAGKIFEATPAGHMLNSRIKQAYDSGIEKMRNTEGVFMVADGAAHLMHTSADTLLVHAELSEEVFGPSSLVVTAESKEQLLHVAENLHGHLTATIHGTPSDLEAFSDLVKILERKVGRLIFNGFPTGVEVAHAMVHGGPFPSTSDGRSTSVGTGAIYRFTRPVCYQDFPEQSLPPELRNDNPLNLWRMVNGDYSMGKI